MKQSDCDTLFITADFVEDRKSEAGFANVRCPLSTVNLSCFCRWNPKTTQHIPQKSIRSSRQVYECKPLVRGSSIHGGERAASLRVP